MKTSRKRRLFLLASVLLFCTEVCIALFVDDRFIRPFGGDILVVVLMYCAVRVCIPDGVPLLSLWIFLFAVCIECLQYVQILELLHLSHIRLLTILAGTSFSFLDILCYAAGCICTSIFEYCRLRGECAH